MREDPSGRIVFDLLPTIWENRPRPAFVRNLPQRYLQLVDATSERTGDIRWRTPHILLVAFATVSALLLYGALPLALLSGVIAVCLAAALSALRSSHPTLEILMSFDRRYVSARSSPAWSHEMAHYRAFRSTVHQVFAGSNASVSEKAIRHAYVAWRRGTFSRRLRQAPALVPIILVAPVWFILAWSMARSGAQWLFLFVASTLLLGLLSTIADKLVIAGAIGCTAYIAYGQGYDSVVSALTPWARAEFIGLDTWTLLGFHSTLYFSITGAATLVSNILLYVSPRLFPYHDAADLLLRTMMSLFLNLRDSQAPGPTMRERAEVLYMLEECAQKARLLGRELRRNQRVTTNETAAFEEIAAGFIELKVRAALMPFESGADSLKEAVRMGVLHSLHGEYGLLPRSQRTVASRSPWRLTATAVRTTSIGVLPAGAVLWLVEAGYLLPAERGPYLALALAWAAITFGPILDPDMIGRLKNAREIVDSVRGRS